MRQVTDMVQERILMVADIRAARKKRAKRKKA